MSCCDGNARGRVQAILIAMTLFTVASFGAANKAAAVSVKEWDKGTYVLKWMYVSGVIDAWRTHNYQVRSFMRDGRLTTMTPIEVREGEILSCLYSHHADYRILSAVVEGYVRDYAPAPETEMAELLLNVFYDLCRTVPEGKSWSLPRTEP